MLIPDLLMCAIVLTTAATLTPAAAAAPATLAAFPGRPGQPEALEAIASYWKDIDVDLKIVQHDPTEFYTQLNRPHRAYRPMTPVTWGWKENGEYIADQAASESGGRALYNDKTSALAKDLASTLDEAKQLRLMAEIEDKVLRNHWVIPFYDTSAVYAHADRVLAHPMPEFGAHFLDLNRIVPKK
jgi:ABC-type transport system substrate-binding protein